MKQVSPCSEATPCVTPQIKFGLCYHRARAPGACAYQRRRPPDDALRSHQAPPASVITTAIKPRLNLLRAKPAHSRPRRSNSRRAPSIGRAVQAPAGNVVAVHAASFGLAKKLMPHSPSVVSFTSISDGIGLSSSTRSRRLDRQFRQQAFQFVPPEMIAHRFGQRHRRGQQMN